MSGTKDEIITVIGCNLALSSGKSRPIGKHIEELSAWQKDSNTGQARMMNWRGHRG